MEKLEQSTAKPEISSTEILKTKAGERIREDIVEAKKRLDETDLSEDFVLISKLSTNEVGEYQKKVKNYENELKEVEAGTINPEYVLYNHADVDEKLSTMAEKVAPDSELATILKSEQELRSMSPEDAEFIKNYAIDVSRLRDISARHKEIEKEVRDRGTGSEEEVWLRADKINLELDLRKRNEKFFRDMDPKRVDELRAVVARFGKRNDLRYSILHGNSRYTNSEVTPFEVQNHNSKEKVPSYYGQIDAIYKEFKKTEAEKFPRAAETVENVDTAKAASQPEIVSKEKDGNLEVATKDADALRKVRESLGIDSSAPDNISVSEKSEKLFVSPETVRGYKNTVEQLSDHFGSLNRVLRDRYDEGLADLVDDNEAGRMVSVMRGLTEIDIKEKQDFEDISASFARLYDSVESIGTIRSRNVKEDPDSLKSVANALMMVGESSQDVGRQLKIMETPEAMQAAKQADRLADVVFDRRMAMLRRMDQIGDYLRR